MTEGYQGRPMECMHFKLKCGIERHLLGLLIIFFSLFYDFSSTEPAGPRE